MSTLENDEKRITDTEFSEKTDILLTEIDKLIVNQTSKPIENLREKLRAALKNDLPKNISPDNLQQRSFDALQAVQKALNGKKELKELKAKVDEMISTFYKQIASAMTLEEKTEEKPFVAERITDPATTIEPDPNVKTDNIITNPGASTAALEKGTVEQEKNESIEPKDFQIQYQKFQTSFQSLILNFSSSDVKIKKEIENGNVQLLYRAFDEFMTPEKNSDQKLFKDNMRKALSSFEDFLESAYGDNWNQLTGQPKQFITKANEAMAKFQMAVLKTSKGILSLGVKENKDVEKRRVSIAVSPQKVLPQLPKEKERKREFRFSPRDRSEISFKSREKELPPNYVEEASKQEIEPYTKIVKHRERIIALFKDGKLEKREYIIPNNVPADYMGIRGETIIILSAEELDQTTHFLTPSKNEIVVARKKGGFMVAPFAFLIPQTKNPIQNISSVSPNPLLRNNNRNILQGPESQKVDTIQGITLDQEEMENHLISLNLNEPLS